MKKFFRHLLLRIAIVFAFSGMTGIAHAKSKPVNYVNPFIGTDSHGHTFPGAALPAGMVQLSPDTGIKNWDWGAGYHYSDSSVMGFSHLHRSGMGTGDWGDILLMPVTGQLRTEPGSKENPDEGYRSRFSHQEEKASPGYYSVELKDYGIKVELTVSKRAGFHKYTFPESDSAHILIDMNHGIGDLCTASQIKMISDTEIEGYRASRGFIKEQKVYFCARFSKPFHAYGTWNGEDVKAGSKEDSGGRCGAYVNYITSENEVIQVKVGISYTSIEQARLNMDTEIPGWNFDRIKENAERIWNRELGKIEVKPNKADAEDYNKHKLTTFYTALYHALLFPAAFCDVDGKYMGMDNQVHSAEGFTYLSDFSLWDTFRAEMPLLTLIAPERNNNAVNTMIAQYEQGGWLPTPQQFGNSYTNDMIGDHPVVAILDAWQKGIRNYPIEKAYEAVRKNAMETPPADHRSHGRVGLTCYLKYGYLPYDEVRESVSRTLEYAYNDWCMAQLAKVLGKTTDYQMFLDRSKNYKKVMDTLTGFARPKDTHGNWLDPFDPTFIGQKKERNYTEANAWQYTWFVPHNVQGLIDVIGGKTQFIQKLDSLFNMTSEIKAAAADATGRIGQYAHGNEPSHHIMYLYNYAGVPWKTQNMIRKATSELYSDNPAGLCGNDDMGQMSAWYILSTMGFYPVTPGQNVWVIGSPEFSKVTLHLDKAYYDASKLVIKTRDNSKDNKYIQSATLNGQPLNSPWFSQEVIKKGGRIIYEMRPTPNKSWGNGRDVAPPSL